jgi:hypothetical protein
MISEPDFATILAERRASAEKTLRPISPEELKALATKLFPDGMHPWAEVFAKFIEEHPLEEALQGEVPEGVAFVYYPVTRRGLWYQYSGGVKGIGPLSENSLKVLSEIVAER